MTLKEKRLAMGLTQVQFAELLDIPVRSIKSWDCGDRKPPDWVERLIFYKIEQIEKEKGQ